MSNLVITLDNFNDYFITGQSVKALYDQAKTYIESGNEFIIQEIDNGDVANEFPYRSLDELRTLIALRIFTDGLLFKKDEIIGEVRELHIHPSIQGTLTINQIGGGPISIPQKQSPSTLSFEVDGILQSGNYYIITNKGKQLKFITSNIVTHGVFSTVTGILN